jgi:hypothetical protein
MEEQIQTQCWELWRQDDNGIKVLMDVFDTEEQALKLQNEFEERKHKQTYWVEKKEGRAGK